MPAKVPRCFPYRLNLGWGACARCRAGLSRHCAARTVLGILGRDGALAENVALPVGNLHAVPDALDDDGAAFIEPVAACIEVLEQVQVEADARALDGAVDVRTRSVAYAPPRPFDRLAACPGAKELVDSRVRRP